MDMILDIRDRAASADLFKISLTKSPLVGERRYDLRVHSGLNPQADVSVSEAIITVSKQVCASTKQLNGSVTIEIKSKTGSVDVKSASASQCSATARTTTGSASFKVTTNYGDGILRGRVFTKRAKSPQAAVSYLRPEFA